MQNGGPNHLAKGGLLEWDELVQIRRRLADEGKKLVLTNGCFDILHAGHVRYLGEARRLGDRLVVALNGDDSVRELKGDGRPVNNENDRAEVLGALRAVDHVTIFRTKRLDALIKHIRPMVYAKGGDYTIDSLDPAERKALEDVGAAIHILPLLAGRSTSLTIEKMLQSEGGET